MDETGFKKAFDQLAGHAGFEKAFNGFFKESDESIFVIELQKSKFGRYYDLNLKIFIQDIFGIRYTKNKDLIKKDVGTIFRRQPPTFKDLLDLAYPMNDELRVQKLQSLFEEFIIPFSEKALSRAGIKELALKDEVFLLPVVKKELMT